MASRANPGQPPAAAAGNGEARGRWELDRRSLLRGGALVGAGVVGGGLVGGFTGHAVAAENSSGSSTEPFYGAHQGGVVTDTQRHTVLAAFDVTLDDRAGLITLLKAWTELAAKIAAGESVTVPIGEPASVSGSSAYADATGTTTTDDSLEAYGLGPNRLTITIGFGRSLFTSASGKDRFGVASRLPAALVELPHFAGQELVADQSDGDLFVQACADDPQVAFHALRSIARVAPDFATLRWTQLGFSPDNTGGTPRNLMGFKDGTINSNVHPPKNLDATLWAGNEGPAWMRGGSYLVYRRIRITLEHWDRIAPDQQGLVIGRDKLTGAPLGAGSEFDPLDLTATRNGAPVIPATAHVRLAAPATNKGAVVVRRAFSYNNGTTPFVERWPPWRQALEYDAGLLFLGYQKDPRSGFIPIQRKLAVTDALNQFTTHTASAVFAVPPAATGPGDWIGSTLFA